MTEETRRVLRAALLERQKWTHEERWQEMIDRGFIDEKGNVLLPSMAQVDCTREPEPEPQASDDRQ